MKKLIGSSIVTGLVVVAALMGSAAPASASDTQCSDGRYCYWNNAIYGGAFNSKSGSSGNMGISSSDNVTNMNDISTSHWNRFGSSVKVYEDVSNSGRNTTFSNGSKISNLSDVNSGLILAQTWNDRISSFTKL